MLESEQFCLHKNIISLPLALICLLDKIGGVFEEENCVTYTDIMLIWRLRNQEKMILMKKMQRSNIYHINEK